MQLRSLAGVVIALVALTEVARAEDFCARGRIHRGKAIDFDMRGADLHDVYRMLADIGNVNVVLAETVRGKVTMRLRRVPWDQVACTVAAVHGLAIDADRGVLLVRPRSQAKAVPSRRTIHRTPAAFSTNLMCAR